MANDAYVLRIKDPADNSIIEVRFEEEYVMHLYKTDRAGFQNLETAKFVLENPKRIFKGILRSVTHNGWCFVGKPPKWFVRYNVQAPLPPKTVFAVYLNERMSIYDLRAELADEEDPLSPHDWKNRFGGITWKSTS